MVNIRWKQDFYDLVDNNLRSTFKNIPKRLAVVAETEKYKYKEDESVFDQWKGKTAPKYECYFDGEFVCFIDSSKGKQESLVDFLTGMKDLFAQGKLFVNEEMYEIKAAERQAELDKINTVELPHAYDTMDNMISNVITKAAKKRGRKVVQK